MFVKTWTIMDPATGVYIKDIQYLTYGEAVAWFWSMFALMIGFPFLNDLFIKLWDKQNKQALIWQKAPKQEQLMA